MFLGFGGGDSAVVSPVDAFGERSVGCGGGKSGGGGECCLGWGLDGWRVVFTELLVGEIREFIDGEFVSGVGFAVESFNASKVLIVNKSTMLFVMLSFIHTIVSCHPFFMSFEFVVVG